MHSDICRVHSPTNTLFYFKKHIKIYIKIHINVVPTCFGLRPSSGSPDDGRRPKHVGAIFMCILM